MQVIRQFTFIPRELHLKLSQHIRELLIFCWSVGIFLTFFVPPFQKPDESAHFFKAISVAQGNLICTRGNDGVFQNSIPQYLKNFPEQMYEQHIASNPRAAFSKHLYLDTAMEDTFSYAFVNEPTSCTLPFLLYLHIGFILSLPVFFQANPLFIFYLGRLINFLTAFALFLFAIKKTPPKFRIIPLLILLLPMTLHQLGSYSKDALHLAAGAIVIAYIMKKLTTSYAFTFKDYLSFFVALTFTILSRPYFLGLSLLSFLIIPLPSFSLKQRRLLLLSSFPFVIALVIFWLIQQQVYVTPAESKGLSITNSSIMPETQLTYIKEHPLQFIKVLHNTMEKELAFIVVSLIGEFGWLDYTLQWYVYLIYTGLIFYVLFKEKKDLPLFTRFSIGVLLSSVILSVVGTALAFYLYATPVAEESIKGLQGRYFIILLPLSILILVEGWQWLGKKFTQALFVFITTSICLAVISRYYNYALHYYRAPLGIESSLNQNIPLTSHMQSYIQVIPGQKLAGVTIEISTLPPPTAAYQLSVLDWSCTHTLRKDVYPAEIFKHPGMIDLVFQPLSLTESQLCIHIQPYTNTQEIGTALTVKGVTNSQTPYLAPVYLY